jgi:hypothetical protein
MSQATERPTGRRTQLARLRATRVKVVFGTAAVLAFGASMAFARLSNAGHAKKHATALTPPSSFLGIVRASKLQAGVVAPPKAPPEVSTATS